MNHDFEDIEIKSNALELLEDALSRKRKKMYDRHRLHDGPIYSFGKRA